MVNDEMTSFNLEDMDVEELEDRLELAFGGGHTSIVPDCIVGDPCPVCSSNCTNYCPGLCNADLCYSD